MIPNGLDAWCYSPMSQREARHILSLDLNKKIILLPAYSLKEKRKGMDHFLEVLPYLKDMQDVYILFVGSKPQELSRKLPLPHDNYCFWGFVESDQEMALLYSASDVVVVPSRCETFGQVFSEAAACGVPIVGFNNSAIPEVVDHAETGYLVEDGNITDMAVSIRYILNAPQFHKHMVVNSRNKVVTEFLTELQAERYVEIYKEITQGK